MLLLIDDIRAVNGATRRWEIVLHSKLVFGIREIYIGDGRVSDTIGRGYTVVY